MNERAERVNTVLETEIFCLEKDKKKPNGEKKRFYFCFIELFD